MSNTGDRLDPGAVLSPPPTPASSKTATNTTAPHLNLPPASLNVSTDSSPGSRAQSRSQSISPASASASASASGTPAKAHISRDEGQTRHAQRRRSIEVVAEAKGDVGAFMAELETKRRQLDEQIHKFISQKEREFKLYERDLRTLYRNAPTLSNAAADEQTSQSQPRTGELEIEHRENRDQVDEQPALLAGKGQAHARQKHEGENDLLGLFTPSFLPLFDGKAPELNRCDSAPTIAGTPAKEGGGSERQELHRAHTEPVIDALNNRLGLGQRTPSSGSERSLISALKTPGQKRSSSKQKKRVSIKINDDLPAIRPDEDLPVDPADTPESGADLETPQDAEAPGSSPGKQPFSHTAWIPRSSVADSSSKPGRTPLHGESRSSSLTQGLKHDDKSTNYPPPPPPPPPQLQFVETPSGILDDLDMASPFSMDEDNDQLTQQNHGRWSDDDDDADSVRSTSPRHSPPLKPSSPRRALPVRAPSDLVIPRTLEPHAPPRSLSSSSSATAMAAASASAPQPISPGFSRPSVREDPIFSADLIARNSSNATANSNTNNALTTAEEQALRDLALEQENAEAADLLGTGSFYDAFARPGSSARQMMSGSLGESFMARNAEALMRRRQSSDGGGAGRW